MDYAATVRSLIDYYINLLIVQYNGKPKARATIQVFIEQLLADGLFFKIRDAYNLDTAVGKQLDIIGKYVGIDRFYKDDELFDFFAYTDYSEADPDAQQKYGFTDYSVDAAPTQNGTLTYNSVVSKNFRLNDDDYRTIIKLRIIQNHSNHSHKSIDDSMFAFFGDTIVADSEGDMKMVYIVRSPQTEVVRAAIFKEALPRPMGVELQYIVNYIQPLFGFATYDNTSPIITGFADYSDFETVQGELLTYNKLV